MSGKFLARASALSLAVFLAACGGDENSTPIVNVNTGQDDTTNQDSGTAAPGDAGSDEITNPDGDPGTPEIMALLGTGTGSNFSQGQLFTALPTIQFEASQSFDLTIADPGTKEPWLKSGQSISYASPCIDAGLASIEGPTSADSGIIKATYISSGCYDKDLVHAFVGDNSTPAASGTVTIEPPENQELALADYNPATDSITAVNTILSTSTSVAKNGQARLTVGIIDVNDGNSLQKGIPFTVNFESFCAGGEHDSLFEPASVTTTSGIAETIFTAGSCTQNPQEITATFESEGEQVVAPAIVKIAVDETQAFQLVAALPDPMTIAPSFLSTEGRETKSTVSFTLMDQSGPDGDPVAFEDVTFTIDNKNAAEFLVNGSPANTITVSTNRNGVATTQVRAKKEADHEEFRIIGTYGDLLTTYSKPIVVNSLLPYQPKFSLSADNYAPNAWNINGVEVPLTIYAADIFGARIRDNTYVNLQTDLGSIDPECVIENGRCTVSWGSLWGEDQPDPAKPYANITASTHGRLENGELDIIKATTTILISTNKNVTLGLIRRGERKVDGTEYCATASVTIPGQGPIMYSPPVGTEISFEVETGEFLSGATESKTIPSVGSLVLDSNGYEVCTKVKPEIDDTIIPNAYRIELTATVQTPDDGDAETEITFDDWTD